MNIGKACAIFEQLESDDYTEVEKLLAVINVVEMETHNGIKKADIIKAFRWFLKNEVKYFWETAWMPIKKMMPKENEDVLLRFAGGGCVAGYWERTELDEIRWFSNTDKGYVTEMEIAPIEWAMLPFDHKGE